MITEKQYLKAKKIVEEYEQQLNILAVSQAKRPVCPICRDTGYYTYGGSFGGATMTQRCSCGANCG